MEKETKKVLYQRHRTHKHRETNGTIGRKEKVCTHVTQECISRSHSPGVRACNFLYSVMLPYSAIFHTNWFLDVDGSLQANFVTTLTLKCFILKTS